MALADIAVLVVKAELQDIPVGQVLAAGLASAVILVLMVLTATMEPAGLQVILEFRDIQVLMVLTAHLDLVVLAGFPVFQVILGEVGILVLTEIMVHLASVASAVSADILALLVVLAHLGLADIVVRHLQVLLAVRSTKTRKPFLQTTP